MASDSGKFTQEERMYIEPWSRFRTPEQLAHGINILYRNTGDPIVSPEDVSRYLRTKEEPGFPWNAFEYLSKLFTRRNQDLVDRIRGGYTENDPI